MEPQLFDQKQQQQQNNEKGNKSFIFIKCFKKITFSRW